MGYDVGRLRLLKGRITKDTPNLEWLGDNPAKVFDIPVGSIVLRAFAVVIEAFDAGTLDLYVAGQSPEWTNGDGEDNKHVAQYVNQADTVLGDGIDIVEELAGQSSESLPNMRRAVVCLTEGALWATVNQGPWTTGTADVYAIIADPE